MIFNVLMGSEHCINIVLLFMIPSEWLIGLKSTDPGYKQLALQKSQRLWFVAVSVCTSCEMTTALSKGAWMEFEGAMCLQ